MKALSTPLLLISLLSGLVACQPASVAPEKKLFPPVREWPQPTPTQPTPADESPVPVPKLPKGNTPLAVVAPYVSVQFDRTCHFESRAPPAHSTGSGFAHVRRRAAMITSGLQPGAFRQSGLGSVVDSPAPIDR